MLTATDARAVLAAAPAGGTVVSLDHARRRRLRLPRRTDARVLVVGAHALERAGLRRLLDDEPGLVVVGEAAGPAEAAALALAVAPDVVIADAAAVAHALDDRTAVLLLVDRDGEEALAGAVRRGVTGVLAKSSRPHELAAAVRTVAAGGALLPPRALRRLITELVGTASVPS